MDPGQAALAARTTAQVMAAQVWPRSSRTPACTTLDLASVHHICPCPYGKSDALDRVVWRVQDLVVGRRHHPRAVPEGRDQDLLRLRAGGYAPLAPISLRPRSPTLDTPPNPPIDISLLTLASSQICIVM